MCFINGLGSPAFFGLAGDTVDGGNLAPPEVRKVLGVTAVEGL